MPGMPGDLPDPSLMTAAPGVPPGAWVGLGMVITTVMVAFLRNVFPTVPSLMTAATAGRQQRQDEERKRREELQREINELKRESAHNEHEALRLDRAYNRLASICEGQGWEAGTRPEPVEFIPYQSSPHSATQSPPTLPTTKTAS